MDNLTTTISFSIYSNKGVYALLLGAGISKTSGIPTSWDIVQDLIRKLAILKKEQCLPDPENGL
jgi:NAD-dependent SIR2 family protein deacetylase